MSTRRTSRQTFRRTGQGIALVAILGLLSACGGSDAASPAANSTSETVPPAAAEEPSEIGDAAAGTEPAPDTEAAAPAAPTGAKSATLLLDNGESFEFSVRCALEPQISAGSEILFTATSSDDPGIDITQFGDEGPVQGIATISVFDASFDTLWDAGSFYEAFGGTIELALDGSTITGSGAFFPAGDVAAAPVNGTLVANC